MVKNGLVLVNSHFFYVEQRGCWSVFPDQKLSVAGGLAFFEAAVCLVYLQLIHGRSDLLHLLDSKLDHVLHLLLRCLQLGLREPDTHTHTCNIELNFSQ